MRFGRAAGVAALALLASPQAAQGAINDPAFVETSVATMSRIVTGIAWAPDGSDRLFVLRKQGEVRIIENGVLLATPFATITPIVTTSECGLIGIAFDPNFVVNGYVYFFVTVSATEQQIIRYTATGNTGGDKTVIVSGLPTKGANHDGGALGFGADGKLYWAVGDNGAKLGIQNDLTLLASKVGRANADGSIPADNPFYDGDGPNNDYIWARGFRNPFTLTFQPSTGQLWLNVVGTNWEQIFRLKAGEHGGYNWHESNQVPPFVSPVISYGTNNGVVWPLVAAGAVRTNGVVTLTTASGQRLRPGAKITVAGVLDSSFNGDYYVSSVPSFTQITYVQGGLPDAMSGSGTVTNLNIGGAVTGGTFWDSSAVPVAYQGNFFFGDYNTGRLMRATLNAQNDVASVDEWGTAITGVVDMAVGPTGDLYYARSGGQVLHARHTPAAQGLVVSQLNLRVSEGGQAAFNVRLAMEPTGTRNVTVQHSAGDPDVAVLEGATLSFDASNWFRPQRVVVSATSDADSIQDEARLRVASSGLTRQLVNVRVTDDESFSAVVSPSALEVAEGSSVDFEVSLTQPPPGALAVNVTRTSGDASASVTAGAQLSFDASNWSTPQIVSIAAAEDADALDGSATFTVTGNGLTDRQVALSIADNDDHAPELTTAPVTTAVVGAPYQYDADASGLPEPVFALDAAPAGMTIDPSTGVVAWTPMDEVDVTVTVRASNGVGSDAVQTFDIDVVADEAPTCALTAPLEGAVLAGDGAEFFGDVFDDVGAVRAEFSIDGQLAYEDVNDDGHYHYGGTHNLLDTTALSDGEHVLAMTGYDTAGQSCVAEVTVTVQNEAAPGGEGGAGGADAGPEPAEGGTGTASGGEPGAVSGGAEASGGAEGPDLVDGAGQGGELSGEPPSGGSGSEDGGCDCRSAPGGGSRTLPWAALLLGLAALRRRRASGGRLRQ